MGEGLAPGPALSLTLGSEPFGALVGVGSRARCVGVLIRSRFARVEPVARRLGRVLARVGPTL